MFSNKSLSNSNLGIAVIAKELVVMTVAFVFILAELSIRKFQVPLRVNGHLIEDLSV